jgi:hypothetical protein
MATTIERLKELEIEVERCEDCAKKFASGEMVFSVNGGALPQEMMANRYKQYAENFREMIALYKENM